METSKGQAAPESGTSNDNIPTVEELTDDPEIAALLDFEPVPRKRAVDGGWTPELQREFIARLACGGSPGRACEEMGKNLTGMMKLYRSPAAAAFRVSWHAAVELAKQRRAGRIPAGLPPAARAPSLDHRRKHPSLQGPLPGQLMNERGEWEDEESIARRAADAKDSISVKMQRSRRLFLKDISDCPAKRAAFEILAEIPVDWELAAQCRPQADEPWRKPNMRTPEMLLAAEAGWLGGEFVCGPDRKAELLAEMNEWRAQQGLEPVGWKDEE